MDNEPEVTNEYYLISNRKREPLSNGEKDDLFPDNDTP